MNVSVGDSIILISAENTSSIIGIVPKIKKFKIIAIFRQVIFNMIVIWLLHT